MKSGLSLLKIEVRNFFDTLTPLSKQEISFYNPHTEVLHDMLHNVFTKCMRTTQVLHQHMLLIEVPSFSFLFMNC